MSNDDLVKKLKLTPSENSGSVSQDKQDKKVEPQPVKTKADVMWDTLESTELDLFGLPNQKLCDYCKHVRLDPEKLFLVLKRDKSTATAIVSALSNALYPKYNVEQVEKFFIVTEA